MLYAINSGVYLIIDLTKCVNFYTGSNSSISHFSLEFIKELSAIAIHLLETSNLMVLCLIAHTSIFFASQIVSFEFYCQTVLVWAFWACQGCQILNQFFFLSAISLRKFTIENNRIYYVILMHLFNKYFMLLCISRDPSYNYLSETTPGS